MLLVRFTSGVRVCGSVRLRSGDRCMRVEQDQRGDYVLEPTALAEKPTRACREALHPP